MTIDTIDSFLDRFGAAWNDGDAGAFASLFIEDATFVTCEGQWLRGREQIARTHLSLFRRGGQGETVSIRLLNERALGPAVRLVVTEARGETQTFTLILRDRRWACAAFHNTAASGQAAAE